MSKKVFRAWDDINKQMLEHRQIGILLKNINNISSGKKQWYFMLYTGLKDRNDKKIFEDDILKHHGTRNYNGYIGNGIVIFENAGFVVQRLNGDDMLYWLYGCSDLEIIGNKYQNPELLK